jgi:formate dehydrogenase major subunit
MDGHLHSIRCIKMQLGAPDEKGRRRPVPIPDSEYEMPVSTLLIAIGEAPDPSFLPPGTSVQVAAWGGLLVNKGTLATGAPGVFAAGDVTYGPKTIIHAAAHGRLAARSVHAYLRKLPMPSVHEMPDDDLQITSTLPAQGFINLDLSPIAREEMPLSEISTSRDRTHEFATGFTEVQARHEASRCLRCDLATLCPTIHVIQPETLKKAQAVR